MVTDLNGNRVPYVGYKRSVVDPELIDLFEMLSKNEQRRVKKVSKSLDETRYEYLEELLIDYENAHRFARDILNNGLIKGFSALEFTNLLLLFGIGVSRRRPDEISLISGEFVREIEAQLEDFKENYSETIDEIYDVVMQYISSDNKKEAVLK